MLDRGDQQERGANQRGEKSNTVAEPIRNLLTARPITYFSALSF
jgi:hypothetical protein